MNQRNLPDMNKMKFWYEEMPGLFKAEDEVLKNGLDFFRFVSQVPNAEGFIQYMGELTFDGDKKQVIVIAFPHSYPYSPPEIYPFKARLDDAGKVEYSVTPGDNRLTRPFFRGNQYNDDKICLFKDEEEWTPFVDGVAMALRQAQAWLKAANSNEGFTTGLVVDEIPPVIDYAGQVLSYLPDTLPDAPGGNLKLKIFKQNYFSLLEITFDNQMSTQVIKGFPDGTVLSPSKADIIWGKWFHFKSGDPKQILPSLQNPINFRNILATEFKTLIDSLLPTPEAKPKIIVIGFRIGVNAIIHCFQIYYWTQGLTTVFQPSYLLPKNLTNELFSRIDSLFDLEFLKGRNVLAIGAGAIGSEVLKELAASSVGKFTVVDGEKFDVGNSVRHAADLTFIGENKVDVIKKVIEARNPLAKVTPVPQDIFKLSPEDLAKYISEHDVVLDFTANRLVERYLHQKAFVEQGKTVIQAAVSKGALTGMVLIMSPGNSACFECLVEEKSNFVPISTLSTHLMKNAPADFGACSQPALPGSGLDTREVSLQAARIILQFLLGESSAFYPKLSGYQYYWHGPAGSINAEPFVWEIKNIGPRPGCQTCNLKNGKSAA
jgi:molybdopterin/thiamine biosynthesis adenylyltransferase/ubiquitin-protein ligase